MRKSPNKNGSRPPSTCGWSRIEIDERAARRNVEIKKGDIVTEVTRVAEVPGSLWYFVRRKERAQRRNRKERVTCVGPQPSGGEGKGRNRNEQYGPETIKQKTIRPMKGE